MNITDEKLSFCINKDIVNVLMERDDLDDIPHQPLSKQATPVPDSTTDAIEQLSPDPVCMETDEPQTPLPIQGSHFVFQSSLLQQSFHITQVPTGVIGCKVYPGALVMCGLLEELARLEKRDEVSVACRPFVPCVPRISELESLSGKTVLELGAGVCGLPSLLAAHCGARVVATDMPNILPDLCQNICRNAIMKEDDLETPLESGQTAVIPLVWGDTDSYAEFKCKVKSFVDSQFDLIMAADVVYHEPLIEPLLHCLLWLTHPGNGRSPPVVITYVQRFKRAKKFLKAAKRYFHILKLAGPDVVDYDILLKRAKQAQDLLYTGQRLQEK